MFIATCFCDWKCCIESAIPTYTCQNSNLAKQKNFDISITHIYSRYISNVITSAIVIGGLEPFKQFDEVFNLIKLFRDNDIEDDFVIYTGYYPYEIQYEVNQLKQFKNIIIKYGRYLPNKDKRFDEVLGIELISDNQFAERIS
jgi:hypothetical protein